MITAIAVVSTSLKKKQQTFLQNTMKLAGNIKKKEEPKKADKKLLLQEVKRILSEMELPKEIQLEPHAKITDVRLFLDSHISVIGQEGEVVKPYAERFKKVLGILGVDLNEIAKKLLENANGN